MAKKIMNICGYFLSFFIPSLIFFILLKTNKFVPFGDKTLIIYDLQGQYISLISYFKSLFSTNNDFIYTFSKNTGGDMVSILTYYLFSPLNILYLFFPLDKLPLAISLITTLKIGLCGLAFFTLMQKLYKNPLSNLIFAFSYALSSYMIVYHFNIMWIDAVILLPLIIIGLLRIFEGKKPYMFAALLAISIISNYYIGFMTCIGVVIFFLYEMYRKERLESEVKLIYRKFIEGAIIAGALSSMGWLTAIMAMSGTKTQIGNGNIMDFSLLFNFERLFTNLNSGSFTGVNDIISGPPLIFCGCIITYLVILYFCNKKIEIREKIAGGVVLAFFIVVFLFTGLNNLFHGGAAPSWFPFRNAFLFVFFIIYLAARQFNKKQEGFEPFHIVVACGFVLIQLIINKWAGQETLISKDMIFLAIMAVALLFLYKFKKFWAQYIAIGVLLVINTINLTQNADEALQKNSVTGNSYLSNKLYQEDLAEIEPLIKYVKDYDKEHEENENFYRMEKTFYREATYNLANNDSMMFDYAGLSHYTSSDKINVRNFMNSRLGFHSNGFWSSYGTGSTLSANAIMGVKYIIDREQFDNSYLIPNRLFGGRDSITKLDTFTDKNNKDINIYKNDYALGLGYLTKAQKFTHGIQRKIIAGEDGKDITYWFNNFEYQNYMFKAMANLPCDDDVEDDYHDEIYKDIFKKAEVKTEYTNIRIKDIWRYELINKSQPGYLTFTVKFDKNHNFPYYFFVNQNLGGFSVVTDVTQGNRNLDYFSYYNYAMNPVERNGNDEHVYKMSFEPSGNWGEADVNPQFYYEDTDVLSEYYENLKAGELQMKKVTSSHLKGSLTYDTNKPLLMLSIPYESNWKITVNNKRVTTRIAQDLFLATDLSNLGYKSGDILKIDIKYVYNNYSYTILIGLIAVLYIGYYGYHLDVPIKKAIKKLQNKNKLEAKHD